MNNSVDLGGSRRLLSTEAEQRPRLYLPTFSEM